MSDLLLPSGWTWADVNELAPTPADITDGPFGSNLKTEHYTKVGPRVIRLQNIGDGSFVMEDAHIAPSHFERLRKHEAIAGDVVVAMLGEELPRACLVPVGLGPAIVKADCVRLRPAASLAEPSFVAAGLNSTVVREQAKKLTHGVGRPRLGLTLFRTLKFPLAPLAEQRRIDDAIDSYLSRLDAAVATLEAAQAKLKAYRASVLKAAVEGRLVPTEAALARAEKRDFEPANVLLKRILSERRRRWEEAELTRLKPAGRSPKDDRWKTKYEEPEPPDTNDLPRLPAGWCWASLDQLLTRPLANGKSVPDGDGFPVLRLTCIRDGMVDLSQRKSGAWGTIDPLNFAVKPDDFLVVRGNGSINLVGRGARVPSIADLVAFPDTLIRVAIAADALVPALLARWWDSPPIRSHLQRRAKTTAGIYKVNQTDLAETPVPLPPYAEQRRIHDEIERVDSVATESNRELVVAAARCARLRQAILKWAFEGRLVDQDPNDEPAAKLLERIRAERANSDTPKRTRRARNAQ